MGKRIHIVGSSPRTGTTLMTELMVNGFRVDGWAPHELSIFLRPEGSYRIFCSKNPQDVLAARPLLRLDRDLWMIHMVRDPRDVVVSRHGKEPSRYWTNLRIWKAHHAAARRARGHPRFLTVRYEDLVREPDRVQDRIQARMPFLERRARFSEFHRTAAPSPDSLDALGEVRPVSTGSIGAWRRHKPRLAAQLRRHGDIDRDLRELGYEADAGWREQLEGVVPDNGVSALPERRSRARRLRDRLALHRAVLRYALGRTGRAALP